MLFLTKLHSHDLRICVPKFCGRDLHTFLPFFFAEKLIPPILRMYVWQLEI